MSDEPAKPHDPRRPQPDTPHPAPPAVFDGMPEPTPPPAPPTPPVAPTPPPAPPAPPVPPAVQPFAAPTPTPPSYQPPAAPIPPSTAAPYQAPAQPPATPYGQPPAAPPNVAAASPDAGFGSPFEPANPSPVESGDSGGGRGPLFVVIGVLIAALGGLAAMFFLGGDDDADVAVDTTSTPATTVEDLFDSTTTLAEATPGMSATVAELAESTVQILLLDGEQAICSGSGTIIDDRGTILTNAHVIEPGFDCPYDRIGIAITADAGVPPELLYIADVYAYDPVVDLAVVRIATDLDGATAAGPFKAVRVGDSDAVTIGDQLRILGYPGIGGDTVTFTNGVVSGFASQNGIGARSWIKTDATIAGGNSGGAAFDDDGNLVGVPTQASASDTGDIVDCRVITDTNGDGSVDGLDQCVPIGGFLNGLRPVNLALPLIDQADTGAPISIQESVAVGDIDVSELYIYNPGWSLLAPDAPEFADEFVLTATAGAENLCLWFDWEGLPDGVLWDGIWQVDGVVEEGFSFFSEEWSAGEDGVDYWLCAVDPTGLASGLYEFIFYVEGEVAFYESFEITETPRPLHDLTFVNNTGGPVCYLFVAPFGAVDSGLDELGRTELLEAGGSRTVTVPEGTVIADAYDCEFDPVYVNYDGLAVSGPTTVELTG